MGLLQRLRFWRRVESSPVPEEAIEEGHDVLTEDETHALERQLLRESRSLGIEQRLDDSRRKGMDLERRQHILRRQIQVLRHRLDAERPAEDH